MKEATLILPGISAAGKAGNPGDQGFVRHDLKNPGEIVQGVKMREDITRASLPCRRAY